MSDFNNPDFAEGLRCQNLGLYPQAFDYFFTMESAGLERTFRKCCEMAWSDQLQERQMERLLYELDFEVKQKNKVTIYNYGLVAHNRSTFNKQQMLTDINQFINQYNILVKEYFSSKSTFSCSRFIDLRKSMKKYRRDGIEKNGIRSTENLAYRLLRRLNVNLQSINEELSFDCENEHYSLKN